MKKVSGYKIDTYMWCLYKDEETLSAFMDDDNISNTERIFIGTYGSKAKAKAYAEENDCEYVRELVSVRVWDDGTSETMNESGEIV